MSLSEMLLPEFDDEMANTRRLLACVPDGKTAWQPHEKSMTLGRLATHVAEIPNWTINALTKDELDVRPQGQPYQPKTLGSTAEILDLFDRNVAAARTTLAAASDRALAEPWVLKAGGQTISTSTRLSSYRRFALNHLVHHRAQLGVYLRLNGVPIPGMYGPSADDRAGRL
jgi:uncharacterized damage-inducible protein DinB